MQVWKCVGEGILHMKRIAVLTGGGDAPGMNAAIRAVVRAGIGRGMEIFGVMRGYEGLVNDRFEPMNSRSVSGIINRGGTILKTIRFPQFNRKDARAKALENLSRRGIEGLVAIGGDGTSRGAFSLWDDAKFPVVAIPASIDNDILGTDMTIGFDTAINIAMEAVDRIRDTAFSHERVFVVEVMGRECGNLAVAVGAACGAEIVLIPEAPLDWENLCRHLEEQESQGKESSIIILAEGAGKATVFTERLQERFPGREVRFSILGYIQRGGRPTALTRIIATRMGIEAVRFLAEGTHGVLTGMNCDACLPVPLKESVSGKKVLRLENLELTRLMAI